ncbi:phosphotransferase [Candidatus Vidania fulgoroideorum]
MAVYTNINKRIKNIINQKYLIKKKKIKGIKSGSENSNFFLNKKYILTIIEKEKKIKNIIDKLYIMEALHFNNIACPKIIRRKNGKKFFMYKKKISIITQKILGKSSKYPSKYQCFRVGILLAKIHKKNKFNYLMKNNFFNLNNITKIYKKYKFLFNKQDKYFINKGIKKIKFNLKIPFGLNHCDIFKDNVFFKKSKLSGIFDFYFSGLDFFVFDISIIIIEWCFLKKKINKKNIKYFIKSYNSERKIKKREIYYMFNYIKIVCMRFFITRKKNNFIKKKKKNPYFFKKIFYFFLKKKNLFLKKIKKFINDKKFYN